jgi:hypothetical protein
VGVEEAGQLAERLDVFEDLLADPVERSWPSLM